MDPDFIGKRMQMEEKPINVEEEEEEGDDDQETTYDQEEEENSNVDYMDAEEMEEMDGTIGDADDLTAVGEGGSNQLFVAMASIQANRQKCQMEKKEWQWQQSQMENRKLQGMLNVAKKQKAEMVIKQYLQLI
jgi:hypothetical protein